MKKVDLLLIVLIFCFSYLTYLRIQLWLGRIDFIQPTIFATDLLSIPFSFDKNVVLTAGLFNLAYLFYMGNLWFKNYYRYFPVLFYCSSPWVAYLLAASSFYIVLLSFTLLISLGFRYMTKEKSIRLTGNLKSTKKAYVGLLIVLLALAAGSYLYIYFILISIFFFVWLKIFKLVDFKLFAALFLSFICLISPLILGVVSNPQALKNVVINQSTISQDVGLVNSVNQFLGEASVSPLSSVARLTENRYLYIGKYLLVNLVKHFAPATFFTYERQIFGFSFLPLIFIGWAPFLICGVWSFFSQGSNKKYIILFSIFLIPSLLSLNSPNIARLLLIFPGLIGLVVLGINRISDEQTFKRKILIFFSLVLILAQSIFSYYQVSYFENVRLLKYLGDNSQIRIQ